MASASRMGIVPPLFNDVMAMTRLVRPVNKKLQNFTAQKYGTQMDDRQLLTNSLHTCGHPRVLCFILKPILLNRERNLVMDGGMEAFVYIPSVKPKRVLLVRLIFEICFLKVR